jgi:poly(3-hydroxybutyrate) depolymerase
MIYWAYQAQSDFLDPVRAWARSALQAMEGHVAFPADHPAVRTLSAAYQMIERQGLTHTRPPYAIASVMVGNRETPVAEETVVSTPFATLLRFHKDVETVQPRVLVVAPLSGHFATLLRGTIKTLLRDHEVYVTDWHNARDVDLAHGRFGFDEYVEHIIRFLETMGPGGHLVAVCQPCVPALAAAALMAEDSNPAQPRSMTLMAGPIDTRISPTKVNELAKSKPIEWFERNLIARVPPRFVGAGRAVYPGFMQLSAFVSMNMDKHIKSHVELFEHLARGETEQANIKKAFYDEYFAVLDLAAEFYIETVRSVFQDHDLPLGKLRWRDRTVDPRAIRRTALLTVEGEKDDICAVGQTLAAHDMCSAIRPARKRHHMQAGVGHYGVFSGKRWESQIYPLLRNVILAND